MNLYMATEQNLASAVNNFSVQAKELEGTRQALVDRIMGVVKTEIVPEVSPLLPSGYSINADRSDVRGISGFEGYTTQIAHGSVPTGFSVHLRLYYEGEPIKAFRIEEIKKIGEIKRGLEPKLEELAKRYNLDEITIVSEPGRA